MAVPQNKEELISAITTTYAKLIDDLRGIPSTLTYEKELPGHKKDTQMSVCNLVSYLIGWGELVLKWHGKKERGEEVTFPEDGYTWNTLGDLALKFYDDYESESYEDQLDHLDNVVKEILDVVENVSDEILYGEPWYNQWPMGRMVQLNTSSPYKNARTRVRKWKREREL